jgi:DNA-binding transcriptional ArsR family regulator
MTMGIYAVGDTAQSVLSGVPVNTKKSRSGAKHRTGVPVRAGSLEANTFEETFFQVPSKGEPDRMLAKARYALDAGRKLLREHKAGLRSLTASERLLTTLTASAVRIYEELTKLARLCAGKVYPSYDHLVEATGLGRSTVRRALAVLEVIGFIIRQRRFKRVEADGPGPRFKQTSNVYRILTPKSVHRYTPRWMRSAPPPVDDDWRRSDEAEQVSAMVASLSCKEFAKMSVGGVLGGVLAQLGAAMDNKEDRERKASARARVALSCAS